MQVLGPIIRATKYPWKYQHYIQWILFVWSALVQASFKLLQGPNRVSYHVYVSFLTLKPNSSPSYHTLKLLTKRMQNSALLSKDLSYFRFNVPDLENVALDECTTKERIQLSNSEKMQTIDFIERQTFDYLAQAEVRKSVHTCAQMIVAYCQSLWDTTSHMKKQGMQKDFGILPVTLYLLGLQSIHRFPRPEVVEAASRLRSVFHTE